MAIGKKCNVHTISTGHSTQYIHIMNKNRQFLESLTNNTTPFLHLCTESVFEQTHQVLTEDLTTK